MFGIYFAYKWSHQEGHKWRGEPKSTVDLTTRNRNLYGPFGAKRSFTQSLMSYKKLFSILTTLMTQIADSLLDALYFVQMKSKPRLIHVPAHIQAFQGVLLYTCEYQVQDEVQKSLLFSHTKRCLDRAHFIGEHPVRIRLC